MKKTIKKEIKLKDKEIFDGKHINLQQYEDGTLALAIRGVVIFIDEKEEADELKHALYLVDWKEE